jgi:hypothetical protein
MNGKLSCRILDAQRRRRAENDYSRNSGSGGGRIGYFQCVSACLVLRQRKYERGCFLTASAPMYLNSAPSVHRCCCLCVPGSSHGRKLDDRRVVQMEQWLAGRSRSRSQVFHGMEPDDTRSLPHLVRSSLPYGKACSAWGSNNRVPGRTPDPQR